MRLYESAVFLQRRVIGKLGEVSAVRQNMEGLLANFATPPGPYRITLSFAGSCWPFSLFFAGSGGASLRLPLKDAVDDDKEIAHGQAAHEDADEAFDRREQSVGLCKHDIAIANGRVGNSGEVEGRFGVGEVTAPEIEECPESDLREV